jgi:serine/threonine protein kinase
VRLAGWPPSQHPENKTIRTVQEKREIGLSHTFKSRTCELPILGSDLLLMASTADRLKEDGKDPTGCDVDLKQQEDNMTDHDNNRLDKGGEAEPPKDDRGENGKSRGEKPFTEAHNNEHRVKEDLGECRFECEEEEGALAADESQASILQNQTQQNTQILGLDDLFFEGNSMMGNSQLEGGLGGRSVLMSPAQQRKIPWGRLNNTSDPTVVLDMFPRAPRNHISSVVANTSSSPQLTSSSTMCTLMGLRVSRGDVFNEHEIGRSAKCDLVVSEWDASPSDLALLLEDASPHSHDKHLRRKAIQEVRKRCHGMVSNRHFKLHCLLAAGGVPEVYIEDTSGNGTIINSTARLRRGERRLLHTGDEISVVNPLLVRSCVQASIQAVLDKDPGSSHESKDVDAASEGSSMKTTSVFSSSWRHQMQRLVHGNYSYLFINLHQQHCVPFRDNSALTLLSQATITGFENDNAQISFAPAREDQRTAPRPRRISPPDLETRPLAQDGLSSDVANEQMAADAANKALDDSYISPLNLSSAAQKRPRPGGVVNVRNLRSKSMKQEHNDTAQEPLPPKPTPTERASDQPPSAKPLPRVQLQPKRPTGRTGGATKEPEQQPRFESHYDMREELGSGMCGQVRRAIHRQSGNTVAVKIIKLGKASLAKAMKQRRIKQRQQKMMAPNQLKGNTDIVGGGVSEEDNHPDLQLLPPDIKAEAIILKSLSHPYIVKLYDVFVDMYAKCVYLVMELVKGGDLFDRIVSQPEGHYHETSARRIMRRLLSPVVYLHSCGIVHRDLKPENILCSSTDLSDDCGIKITDFGLAKQLTADGLKTFCGTPQYFAPEVLSRRDTVMGRGRYGQEADCWSLGVILYILLCGMPPFDFDNGGGTYSPKNLQDDEWNVDFSDERWDHVSSEAKELVSLLLERNPVKRLSAKAACDHPWILTEDGDTHTNPLNDPLLASTDMDAADSVLAVAEWGNSSSKLSSNHHDRRRLQQKQNANSSSNLVARVVVHTEDAVDVEANSTSTLRQRIVPQFTGVAIRTEDADAGHVVSSKAEVDDEIQSDFSDEK